MHAVTPMLYPCKQPFRNFWMSRAPLHALQAIASLRCVLVPTPSKPFRKPSRLHPATQGQGQSLLLYSFFLSKKAVCVDTRLQTNQHIRSKTSASITHLLALPSSVCSATTGFCPVHNTWTDTNLAVALRPHRSQIAWTCLQVFDIVASYLLKLWYFGKVCLRKTKATIEQVTTSCLQ